MACNLGFNENDFDGCVEHLETHEEGSTLVIFDVSWGKRFIVVEIESEEFGLRIEFKTLDGAFWEIPTSAIVGFAYSERDCVADVSPPFAQAA